MAAAQNPDHIEEHSSFIKTPKQLIVVILLAFSVPIIIIVMLATLVMSSGYDADHPAMSDEAIAQRIKPVGRVVLGEAGGGAGQAAKSGEEVFKQVCAACHATGVLNAPKAGDKAAWGKLIPMGLDQLTADAIKGIRQMPPRGGNPALSDVEVKRAVVHMANQAGAGWKEPEAPAPAAVAAAPAAPAPVATAAPPAGAPAPQAAAPSAPAASASAASDGKGIYDKICSVCHAAGVAGAPKTGDKAAWAPRLKQGMDALYASALKGKGAMPPKGGAAQLSDAEIKSAVDFLAGQAK